MTISGKICTGKSFLFTALSQKLAWKTYSASQFFREWSQKHGVPLFAAHLRPESLTRKIDEGVREKLLKEKKIIIEGWLAGFMAQNIPGVLKVLLVGEDKERARRFAQREGITPTQAKNEIKKREASLFKKWQKVYGRNDFLKPQFYDLVIETTHREPEEVLNLVWEKLENNC